MDNQNNPEKEKPSLFGFSDEDQARSWPPPSYQTEDEESPESSSELPSEETPLSDIFETTTNDTNVVSDDYVDVLFSENIPETNISEVPVEESVNLDQILIPLSPEEPEFSETLQEPEIIQETINSESISLEEQNDILDLLETPKDTKDNGFDALDEILDSDVYNNQSTTTKSFEQAIFEEDDTSLPFRTYFKQDFTEDLIPPELLAEEDKAKLPINKNLLVVLAVCLLVCGYYGFQYITKPKYDTSRSSRKRRPPQKEKKVLLDTEKELLPIWDLSNQTKEDPNLQTELIKNLASSSGRPNPFAVPDSVIADMRKVQEVAIIKKQAPKTYRRKAYRAILIGVLTSKDNTIAIVNQQEAVFDILEGTSKDKILKLATKSMDKAKQETLEMVVGSYLGPWKIVRIDAAKDLFTDAKVHLAMNGQSKVLNMGRGEELGIFTDTGIVDNLDHPVGVDPLAEFNDEELDDDSFDE